MGGRAVTAGGVILTLWVAVGTALYVRGIAPEYPTNLWAFQGTFLVCLVYALFFGRAPRL